MPLSFVEENSTVIENDLWMNGTEHFLWPCAIVTSMERLAKEGLPPAVYRKIRRARARSVLGRSAISSCRYSVAADYNRAIRVRRLLGEIAQMPSSDAIVAFDRCGKRSV